MVRLQTGLLRLIEAFAECRLRRVSEFRWLANACFATNLAAAFFWLRMYTCEQMPVDSYSTRGFKFLGLEATRSSCSFDDCNEHVLQPIEKTWGCAR